MNRRFDIDYLKVISFILLIPFHIILNYTNESYIIYGFKLTETNSTLIEFMIRSFDGWRLPLLFMISGIGAHFSFKKRSNDEFCIERVRRLGIPLIFGIFFLNLLPIIINSLAFESLSIKDVIYTSWINGLDRSNIQHLWFILNLLIYSIICLPFMIINRNDTKKRFKLIFKRMIKSYVGLIWLVPIGLTIIKLNTLVIDQLYYGQGVEFIIYCLFYIIGFYSSDNVKEFSQSLKTYKYHIIGYAIISSVILLGIISIDLHDLIMIGIESLFSWTWCLLAFIWANTFHKKSNIIINYLNKTVYCMYLTHIPIILIGTQLLSKTNLTGLESIIGLSIITFVISILIYECFKYIYPVNILLGINPETQKIQ